MKITNRGEDLNIDEETFPLGDCRLYRRYTFGLVWNSPDIHSINCFRGVADHISADVLH